MIFSGLGQEWVRQKVTEVGGIEDAASAACGHGPANDEVGS
jgi:hypothetical protein